MDFSLEYTEEQQAFAKEVGAWLDANIPAGIEKVIDAQKMTKEQFLIRREFAKAMGKKGWLYPSYPVEYGGAGISREKAQVIRHELSIRNLSTLPVMDWTVLAAPAIINTATEEQKRRLLPPMLRGEALTWQLFTEPEAGTDEANQQTNALRAEKDGDYYVITGQKIFVGGMFPPPDQLFCLTRSDPKAPRHQNLSMFIIPANLPGITIYPLDLFVLGTFGSVCGRNGGGVEAIKNSVFLDEVRVHKSYLIGNEGDGWRVTNATFDVEHGGGGEISKNYLVARFLDECRNNPNIKNRIKKNPELLDAVANIFIGDEIDRLLSIRNAGGKGGYYGGPQIAAMGKFYGAKFVTEAAKIAGPYALLDDPEWALDDGRFEVGQRCGICMAPGGTPEAMKIKIARALSIGR